MKNIEEMTKDILPLIKEAMPDEKRLEFVLRLFAEDIERNYKSKINRELNRICNEYC